MAFAFVAMGGWAMFANRTHGLGAAALAGVVQGTISALITLVMKRGLEAFFARLAGPAAAVLPPLASCLIVLAVLVSLHTLAGTKEIWTTIAVPYAVSSSYAILYTLSLARQRKGQAA
ncbi:MAG TPA: hypothetical protein VIO94_04125 [Phenylobacterium sp.]